VQQIASDICSAPHLVIPGGRVLSWKEHVPSRGSTAATKSPAQLLHSTTFAAAIAVLRHNTTKLRPEHKTMVRATLCCLTEKLTSGLHCDSTQAWRLQLLTIGVAHHVN
jgi:hypothetical protein